MTVERPGREIVEAASMVLMDGLPAVRHGDHEVESVMSFSDDNGTCCLALLCRKCWSGVRLKVSITATRDRVDAYASTLARAFRVHPASCEEAAGINAVHEVMES